MSYPNASPDRTSRRYHDAFAFTSNQDLKNGPAASRNETPSRSNARSQHEAPLAPRAAGLRRHRRGHGNATRARRAENSLARARVRAEEFHRGRHQRPEKSQGRGADRASARQGALQLARRGRRHHGGRGPGTRVGDSTPPLARHPKFDSGFRAHNTNVFPQRPDRAYVGYISGGAVILDIADKSRPKLISHWRYSPPYTGFTHTVLPLLDRGLLIVSDEAVKNDGEDWPKLVWVVDAQVETNPVPISTFPMPFDAFARRGGRFGAHNLH